MGPSKKNPRLCALCCEKMPPGGTEVEIAVLFADIRGSTHLAHQLGPTAYANLLNNFYHTATEVLIKHYATIDKLIGDEVMAFFVPGFVGADFKKVAAVAADELMRAVRHGDFATNLPIGIGIDAGVAFVGNVGGKFLDFTALGDPINSAAHIRTAANPGEILIGESAYRAIADSFPNCTSRDVVVKGNRFRVRSLRMDSPDGRTS